MVGNIISEFLINEKEFMTDMRDYALTLLVGYFKNDQITPQSEQVFAMGEDYV